MADVKISALPAATTPLTGTEIVPIVQGGITEQVSVSNLTAGRAVSVSSVANDLGAVGTPSYTFTGDLNTGMWSPTADTVAFSTGGSERARVTSTGAVGVGTTSPATQLEVAASGTAAARVNSTSAGTSAVQLFRTGGSGYQMTADNSVVWNVQRIDSSGAATATPLSIASNDVATFASVIRAATGTVTAPTFSFSADTNTGMYRVTDDTIGFTTNGTERARITSAGNLAVGTTSPNAAARLDVASTTSGFLPPRMTEAQRDAISTPPDGLMLYNTTTNKLQVRAASAWVDLH